MPEHRKDIPKIARIIIFGLFAVAVVLLVIKLFPVILPFFLAILFAYVLRPLILRLNAQGIPVQLAIFIVYFYLLVLIYLLIVFMAPIISEQLRNLAEYLPQLLSDLSDKVNHLLTTVRRIGLPENIEETIGDALAGLKNSLAQYVQDTASRLGLVLRALFYLVLMPILGYYMLRDKHLGLARAITWFPAAERPELLRLCHDIDHLLRQFITGYLLVSLIIGALSGIFYYCIGLDYALALGLIMAIADLIPYFGPYLGAIPAVVVALGESNSLAVVTVIGLVVLQQIEGSVITPKIMGDKVGLHPLATIFAVLAGGYLFGLLGTVLAVPAAAALILILKYLYGRLVGAKIE